MPHDAALEISGPKTRRWLLTVGVGVIAAVVVLFELGAYRTLGSHEVYTAVPAREMLDSGDWILPRFGGIIRLKKPPMGYWLVVASAWLSGEVSAWTARLPAAISALALTALIGFWAARRHGYAAGLAAALVNATSLYTITYGRKTEVDMFLCLLTTAALFLVAGYHPEERKSRSFWRWVGIYFVLALAWLSKFHFGPAMVLAPCVVFFLVQRWYRSLLHLANPVGLMIFAAAMLVWPYLVAQQVPDALEIWRHETLDRVTGAGGLAASAPVFFYIPHILCFSLPWTLLLFHAVPVSWRRAWRERDSHERFVGICFLVQLTLVSIQATRHRNYILPALPILSLLMGPSLVALVDHARRGKFPIRLRGALASSLASLVGAAVGWIFLVRKYPHVTVPGFLVLAWIGIGAGVVAWLAYMKRPLWSSAATMLVFLGGCVGVMGWICPCVDHRCTAARFGQSIRRDLFPENEIVVYRQEKAPIVFYLGNPVRRIESDGELSNLLTHEERLLVVTDQATAEKLAEKGQWDRLRSMTPVPGISPPKDPTLVLGWLCESRDVEKVARSEGSEERRE